MKYGHMTGFEAHEKGLAPAKVELDGVEISNVATIDDEEGWIEVYVTDASGNIAGFKNTDGNYEARTYKLTGNVVYTPNTIKENV